MAGDQEKRENQAEDHGHHDISLGRNMPPWTGLSRRALNVKE
jgi:hypothetical protein